MRHYKYDEETRRELNVSELFMAVDRCVRIKVGRSKKWCKAILKFKDRTV
jgi:hypothetical protein